MEMKADAESIHQQANWAGIRPGMRIADIGCGPGKTTHILSEMAQPGGKAVGIDFSEDRINYARMHYGTEQAQFLRRDVLSDPLIDIGTFDFIWVRFLLEYHRSSSRKIVKKLSDCLNPGGILCLIDLDHNSMSHYGASAALEKALYEIMKELETKRNFDPFAGRKLYSYLYDLGFEDIDTRLSAHHLIFGKLNETDEFNWTQKIEVAAKHSGYDFGDFDGGFKEFSSAFKSFFSDPRRFTYTPLICCRGRKPFEKI